MNSGIARWRRRAEGLSGRGRGRRYPAELQREALGLAAAAVAEGATWAAVTSALNVPLETLRRWDRQERNDFLPVEVVSPVELVRINIGKTCVADVTVDTLAELIRRLG